MAKRETWNDRFPCPAADGGKILGEPLMSSGVVGIEFQSLAVLGLGAGKISILFRLTGPQSAFGGLAWRADTTRDGWVLSEMVDRFRYNFGTLERDKIGLLIPKETLNKPRCLGQ